MTYAIPNNSNFSFSEFGMEDILLAEAIDPGEISTFSGDLAAFRARGGKLISYHGRKDDVRVLSDPALKELHVYSVIEF